MSNHHGPRRRLRHALIYGLCAVPILFTEPGHAQIRPTAAPTYERPSTGGGSGGITPPVNIFQFLFNHPAAPAPGADAPPPDATSTAGPDATELKTLLADGPQFAQSRPADQFEVKALLKGGWPLVVDFLPAPGSCTYVVISIGERAAPPVVIDPDGSQGRRLVRLDFPPGPPESPWPARYRVQSETPACPSRNPTAYSSRPSPLQVFGIGAGPRAVGSISVTDLHVGPPRPDVRTVPITYAFTTKSLFNHAAVTFIRFDRSPGNGRIVATAVRSLPVPSLTEGVHSGQWDGLDDTRQLSLGVNRLQVRAWDNQEDDTSWAGGISSEFVTITRP
ncbi:hypothetical protein [Paraburkholderia aromaticivorans]|uniref:hypothetical protein n=1 Tax=Paraburkholderia aromaticivorans TaxID=2026199 RepID=UPI001456213F|nr:hypothetical protein [Paraburkholderia aromaticivorans]